MNLFPAPNIHRLLNLTKNFLGEALYQISHPTPSPYKKVLWIIIVIVHENIGTKTGDLEQTF